MGTLRSMTDHTGLIVNKITLGEPARDTDDDGEPLPDSEYFWDDSRLPNGVIKDDGTITLDETDDV
jgi:hypothetical protein